MAASTDSGDNTLTAGTDMPTVHDFSEFRQFVDDHQVGATSPFIHDLDSTVDQTPKPFSRQLLQNPQSATRTLGTSDVSTQKYLDSRGDSSFRDSSSNLANFGSPKRMIDSSASEQIMMTASDDMMSHDHEWPRTYLSDDTDGIFMFGASMATPGMNGYYGACNKDDLFTNSSPASIPNSTEALLDGPDTSPAMATLLTPMSGTLLTPHNAKAQTKNTINNLDVNPTPFSAMNVDFWPQIDGLCKGKLPPQLTHSTSMAQTQYGNYALGVPTVCKLFVHPIPTKSRAETPIAIKLTLIGMPPTIKRLHLPTYTISQPRFLAKPPVERAPDMLELYTQLVCSSAMQEEESKKRALARAAKASHPRGVTEKDMGQEDAHRDPQNKPENGGEVRICIGCIARERKRAGRKKIKKFTKEDTWKEDDPRRIIIFNTQEIKEWVPVTRDALPTAAVHLAQGGYLVDAPMRIACYCRHHAETVGFRVIFTIKDFQDRVVAQEMSPSIKITDNHKTHPISQRLQAPGLAEDNSAKTHRNTGSPGDTPVMPASSFTMSDASENLRALDCNQPMDGKPQTPASGSNPAILSQVASPSHGKVNATKRGKASDPREPTEITCLASAAPPELQAAPHNPASAATSPFRSNFHSFQNPDALFGPNASTAVQKPFNAGAMTSNCMEQSKFNHAASLEDVAMTVLLSYFSAPKPR